MSSNIKDQKNKQKIEIIKWIVVAILLITAIFGNHLYQDTILLPLRVTIIIILITAAGCVALLTKKGKVVLSFAREAQIEVRKVIWPSRKETVHTTLIIIMVTSIMSLILWGLDSLLFHLISLLLP